MSQLRQLLDEYASRPARRSGAALEVYRQRLGHGVDSGMLEGFKPMAEDREALELLATGRITMDEYRALAGLLAQTAIDRRKLEDAA